MNWRFYGGVFCVTAATLMLQIIQTRIISVVAWYHLAFFVISTAMFGLTVGAVWVYLRGDRFTERTLSHDLAYFSAAFALSAAVSLALQMTLAPINALGLTSVIVWLELAICLSVPFFFSGVVVSLALTRSPYPIERVYGVDLAGAALGCLGALALLNTTDGPSSIIWAGALAMLGAVLFARTGIGARPEKPFAFSDLLANRGMLLGLLVVIALANGVIPSQIGLRPIFVKGIVEPVSPIRPIYEEWNSFSRVTVHPPDSRDDLHMWGPSPHISYDDWPVRQLKMRIDGDAGTALYGIEGNIESAGFLKYDVTNLAYHLPGLERGAVIGVGGGRDMISARLFGVEHVTGVEVNPIFIRLLTEEPAVIEFTGLDRIGGMTFEIDEARSWFARSTDQFDIVQMSLIDTWAATGAGAFTLSENGLYTVEAWSIFLDRLSLGGVFTVSRWYAPDDVNETGRMVSLAVAALMEKGVASPRDHIFLAAAADRIATLVLSRAPLPEANVALLEKVVAELEFEVLISPSSRPESDVLAKIVSSPDRESLDRYTSGLPLDLTPTTDERPFFFNQLPLWDAGRVIALALAGRDAGVSKGNLVATATLVMLFLLSLVLVALVIVVPLRSAIRDTNRQLAVNGTAYFVLIGIGFMMIEIGLLQRLSVFLGHPIYSLSIVLFSIILTTGIGSLVSGRMPLDSRGRIIAWAVATAGYVLGMTYWLPDALTATDHQAIAVRALVCVLAIAPAGVLMGFGFPTGMRLISRVDRGPTPWFWGINGASGVLASSLAVACSIAFGISTSLAIGAFCYLALIPVALSIGASETIEAVPQPAE